MSSRNPNIISSRIGNFAALTAEEFEQKGCGFLNPFKKFLKRSDEEVKFSDVR